MKRFIGVGLMAVSVSACDPLQNFTRLQQVDVPVVTCPRDPGCVFDRDPLRVLPEPVTIPRRPYTFFPLADDLTFVDPQGRTWVAPRRTLTDGASIPKIFISIVGNPTEPSFIRAAAVHDAYCGIGNELGPNFQNGRWEDVHKMFYDGLVAGGTDERTAQLMFAAVWLGGPRWNTLRSLDHVPAPRLQQTMREIKTYIETAEPDFPTLLAYLWWKELGIMQEYPAFPRDENLGSQYESDHEEEYGGSTGGP